MAITDIALRGNGMTVTFDTGAVANGIFKYSGGRLTIEGLTDAQLEEFNNIDYDSSSLADPRIFGRFANLPFTTTLEQSDIISVGKTDGKDYKITLQDFDRAVAALIRLVPITFDVDNISNSEINVAATIYETESTGEAITNIANPTITVMGNRHAVIEVTTLNVSGVITLSGTSVSEMDDSESADTEDINVTATGCYQSAKKWSSTLTISGVGATDVVADLISTTYFDMGNRDFAFSSLRMGWVPSGGSWDIGIRVSVVEDDGSLTEIINKDFSNALTPGRASIGKMGLAKWVMSPLMNIAGSDKSGAIITITGPGGSPTNIREINLQAIFAL